MSGAMLSAGNTLADKTRSSTSFCGAWSPVDETDINQIITWFAVHSINPLIWRGCIRRLSRHLKRCIGLYWALYILCFFLYIYTPMMKSNVEVRHSKRLKTTLIKQNTCNSIQWNNILYWPLCECVLPLTLAWCAVLTLLMRKWDDAGPTWWDGVRWWRRLGDVVLGSYWPSDDHLHPYCTWVGSLKPWKAKLP